MEERISKTAQDSLDKAQSIFKRQLPSDDEIQEIKQKVDDIVFNSELQYNNNAKELRGIIAWLINKVENAKNYIPTLIQASDQRELAIRLEKNDRHT